MKNILVPIGSSANSGNTLQYAVDFAKEIEANVYVMHAYQVVSHTGVIKKMDDLIVKSGLDQVEKVLSKVNKKGVLVTIATYKGEVLDGIQAIDEEMGIDLIILEPRSNDIRDEVFLGNTSGSIIKQTDIPALIVPPGNVFRPYSSVLAAFRTGKVKNKKKLSILRIIKEKFDPKVQLLLVKTPDYEEDDLKIDPALLDLSTGVTITENATTYQGVLEHFQTNQPDLLVVFRRNRGFFTKLWEKNIILKRDFYTTRPLLVMSAKK